MSFAVRLGSVFLVSLLTSGLGGCRKDTNADPNTDGAKPPAAARAIATGSSDDPTHAMLPPTDVVQGASIYPLKVSLVDHAGSTIGLDVWKGKVVLISMFYTSCPHACPTLIAHLKQVEAALSPAARSETRILLVSFDPEHDTLDVLRAMPSKHQVDSTRWSFATAKDETIREVAAVLGIKYRQADGSFNHSSVITLLDREGKIDMRSDGLEDATTALAARITELAAKP